MLLVVGKERERARESEREREKAQKSSKKRDISVASKAAQSSRTGAAYMVLLSIHTNIIALNS